jgi:hypothetical protein
MSGISNGMCGLCGRNLSQPHRVTDSNAEQYYPRAIGLFVVVDCVMIDVTRVTVRVRLNDGGAQ